MWGLGSSLSFSKLTLHSIPLHRCRDTEWNVPHPEYYLVFVGILYIIHVLHYTTIYLHSASLSRVSGCRLGVQKDWVVVVQVLCR